MFRVLPHCDVHLALSDAATKTVSFRVLRQNGALVADEEAEIKYEDITSDCTVQVLAPHNAVGNRLQSFVTIDLAAKTITANQAGTNLVVFHKDNEYTVIRVQVHTGILAWWFGNEKVTAPLDAKFAHSQPSIYAMFSDDPTGTDRVGDITGHGFVTLTSSNPATFTVSNANLEGRLQGLQEGNAILNGALLGSSQSIPVEVIDYAKTRDLLVPVRVGDLANAADCPNILFLAEGFTTADEPQFDAIVAQVSAELFSKPRHEPFGTLSGSFNIFKAFTPSKDRLVTCGFQVTDSAVGALGKGRPIPFEHAVSDDTSMWNVAELVTRVGLPKRGENRSESALKALWNSQSLNDFKDSKVDGDLVEAWRNSHSLGYLETRDTFFGLMLGARQADGASASGVASPMPASDDGSAPLKELVKRAYSFYGLRRTARLVDMDPRRHAAELFASGFDSRSAAPMRFVLGLRLKDPPHQPLGSAWVPKGTSSLKPSRGLIAIVVNEHMHGGSGLGDRTAATGTIRGDTALTANYIASPNANIKVLRRAVPANIVADLTSTIDTLAHEFGHSFYLGDEYEEFRGDQPDGFDGYDNIAALKSIAVDPNFANSHSRKIDIAKVKWSALPRIKLSARLTAIAQVFNSGKLEVTIDRRETAPWEAARAAGQKAHLCRIDIKPDGRQLPLSIAAADHMTDLTMDSVDTATGKIVLSSPTPPASLPNFPDGSLLFVPHRTEGGAVKTLIEEKVRANLVSTQDPLNKDTDTTERNPGPDSPREISGFQAPCQAARLVGIFEGAGRWTGLMYRATGTCKMRTHGGADENGEYCHVCKWLITNRVDPGKHHVVDSKFYPRAKKNE